MGKPSPTPGHQAWEKIDPRPSSRHGEALHAWDGVQIVEALVSCPKTQQQTLEGHISFDTAPIGAILGSKDIYLKRAFQLWVERLNPTVGLRVIVISSFSYAKGRKGQKQAWECIPPCPSPRRASTLTHAQVPGVGRPSTPWNGL